MPRRSQIVHRQVFHHLAVVIPRVREEDRRRIEPVSVEFLDVRIGNPIQQIVVGQRSERTVRVGKGVLQISDDSSLLVTFLGPS